jgi:PAS domain S-box-containing protein
MMSARLPWRKTCSGVYKRPVSGTHKQRRCNVRGKAGGEAGGEIFRFKRKRVREELRESQQRFRDLVENLNDVVFNLDNQGRFTYISPAIERISAYSAEELVGKSFTLFIHPDDLQGLLTTYERTLSGELEPHEFRVLDKDGSVLHVRTSSRPLYREGDLIGLTGLMTDISKRKRAEEELEIHRRDLESMVEERTRELEEAAERLRRSERYFRALIENAYDIIAVLGSDGVMSYLSPSLKKLSGFTQEERLGENVFQFIHPDDLPGVIEAFTRGLQEPDFMDRVEYRWQHADGSWHWQEAIASNLLDDPVVRGIVVNARDITDRKRVEDSLRESEERYRSLVETSPDCIVLTDLSGSVLMVNQSGVGLFGYGSKEELAGKSVLDLIAPEDGPRAELSMRTKPAEGMARREEYTLVRKDGSRFYGEIIAALLKNAAGEPTGFISVTRDVTERKRAEERLRKLNECFLSLGADPLDNIQRFVLAGRDILDADAIRYVRVEKEEFFIFSSLQAEGGFQRLEDVEAYLCYHLISRGAAGPLTGKDIEDEVFASDPDVRERGFRSFLLHPILAHGEVVGCFNVLNKGDRAYSRMEMGTMAMLAKAMGIEEERYAFEESLRDFVDIASHELRHPVALLAGYTETLDAHGKEMDETTREEIIDAIKQSAQRISRMVRGLVDVSLVERERFFISKRPENLVSLVERVIREMRVKTQGREFRLVGPGEVVECAADPERFHDLMVILLDNAVKYSPESTLIEVALETAGDGVRVSVLDRGAGIPAQHGEKVFERFYQVEEAQHHSKPGLGLGLFLARQIVEGHGGRMWHEPREGGGSAFRFTLPYE